MALIDKVPPNMGMNMPKSDMATELPPDAEPQEAGPSITPEKVAQMQEALKSKVPPKLKSAYERIVTAGKKIMYSEKSAPMVKAELNRPAPVDQKLAHAAAGLILMMNKESKDTMPQDAAVLAGACLLLEMVDLVLKIGTPVSEQDVRDALDTFVTLVMMKHGANEDQIMGALGVKGHKSGKTGAPAAPAAAAPTPQPAVAPAAPPQGY